MLAAHNPVVESYIQELLLKLIVALLAFIGAACAVSAAWLFAMTYNFFKSTDYQPGIKHLFSYGVGLLDLDGGGIFLPSFLLLAIGLFFVKFALDLWRGECIHERHVRASQYSSGSSANNDREI